MRQKHKNFSWIAEVENTPLAYAMLMTAPNSPEGIKLFGAFPNALTEDQPQLPTSLLFRMDQFGMGSIIFSLRREGYDLAVFIHRMPQNDFDGTMSAVKPPSSLTLEDLQRRQFTILGKSWRVFSHGQRRPYETTRPQRVDSFFYCGGIALIGEV